MSCYIFIDKQRKYLLGSDKMSRGESLGCQMKHICFVIGSIISYRDLLPSDHHQPNTTQSHLQLYHFAFRSLSTENTVTKQTG